MTTKFAAQTHPLRWGIESAILDGLATGISVIKTVRFDIFRGHFMSNPAQYDPIIAEFRARGLDMIWTAFDGDPGRTSFPTTQEFVDYVLAVLNRYGPQRFVGLEVWNEPNGTWNGGLGAEGIIQPLANAVAAIKSAVRANSAWNGVKIVAGATAGIPLPWWQNFIAAGVLPNCDAVSVHHYGSATKSAELTYNDLGALQDLLGGKPVWLTEFGATTDPVFAFKQMVVQAARGVVRGSYYLLRDDPNGGFPDAGLLTQAGVPKPVGQAAQAFGRLGGRALLERVPTGPTTYVFTFAGPRSILWSNTGATVNVAGTHVAQDMLGATLLSQASYQLTEEPLLLFGSVVITEDTSGDVVLSDFLTDFKSVQGQPWEYGYYLDGVFTPMEWVAANNRWQGPGTFFWIRNDAIHPTLGHLVTARIKFAGAKRLKLEGTFTRFSTGGDSVDVLVRLSNGTVLGRGHLTPATETPFNIVADVPAGIYVEFQIDPLTEKSFDAVFFSCAVIETADAVSTIPVAVGGNTPPPPPPPPTDGFSGAVTYSYAGGVLVNVQVA